MYNMYGNVCTYTLIQFSWYGMRYSPLFFYVKYISIVLLASMIKSYQRITHDSPIYITMVYAG